MNDFLEKLMFDELKQSCRSGGYGGFLPGMKQIGNVAALPGIVGVRYSSVLYTVILIYVQLISVENLSCCFD